MVIRSPALVIPKLQWESSLPNFLDPLLQGDDKKELSFLSCGGNLE
ncbi:MAG: hypothetical protein SFT68_05730 [Rickettsiaceae bacterium]|nr:hypothetical protein [Rickettsiaceae bacterium]